MHISEYRIGQTVLFLFFLTETSFHKADQVKNTEELLSKYWLKNIDIQSIVLCLDCDLSN